MYYKEKNVFKMLGKLKLNEKIFAVILSAALVVAILPLLRLALYAAPYYDDYGYSLYVKNYLRQGAGLMGVLKGVAYSIKVSWYAWQGTYGSILFMSLMPASFGEKYYFVGLWVIILSFAIATFDIGYTLARHVAKTTLWRAISVASIMSLLLIELVVTAHQGFYWYNGAVHYTFMYSLMLLLLCDSIKLILARKTYEIIIREVAAVILSFLVAGANFVVTLQCLLFMLLVLGISLIGKNKKVIWLILPIIVYVVGMWLNLSAPGNNVRGALYQGYAPVKAVLLSFKEAAVYVPQFTGWITLVVLLALVPVLVNVVREMGYCFKYPALITLFSVCLYATGFTPSLYGMGTPGLDRTLNAVKFTFQILLVINEAYWIGWIINKRRKANKENGAWGYNIIFYLLLAVLVALIFRTSNNQAGSFASYGAYYYVHTGEAFNYRNEYIETLNSFIEGSGEDAIVKAHVFRPWLLCGNNELSDEPNAEQNRFMADYYGINSIRVQE